MEKFKYQKDNNWTALFVNSENPPDRIDRLNIYTYSKDGENKYKFSELCKYHYIQVQDGVSVDHSMLIWETIDIKDFCEESAAYLIDAGKGVHELKD